MKLAIVLGTYNRRQLLEQAIASIRATVGGLAYRIVVVDGGSGDGSREWLAVQADVILIGQRSLVGAVGAFNHGFAYAMHAGAEYIGHFNDDATCADDRMWERAVEILEASLETGAVAFAFNTWDRDRYLHDVVGKNLPYVNYGVYRREAVRQVAEAQGDKGGTKLWNPLYHTWAADSEAGCWLHKLGWKVATPKDLRVDDYSAQDALREINTAKHDSSLFVGRWGQGLESGPRAPVTQSRQLDYHQYKHIHIGCGDKRLEGWLNCDVRETSATDAVIDLYDLREIPDGMAREIYWCHGPEHIYPDRLDEVFMSLRRLLSGDGRLIIATISLPGIYENRFLSNKNGTAWNAALYGECNSTDHPGMAHRQAFTEASLREVLERNGYSRIRTWRPEEYPAIRKLNDYATSCRLVTVHLEAHK